MFIISKRNYRVKRADGSFYGIKKDFIGIIPDDVAESALVQRAIRGGMVCVPEGTKDRELERADGEAAQKASENDVRPDAGEEGARKEGGEKAGEKGSGKQGSKK